MGLVFNESELYLGELKLRRWIMKVVQYDHTFMPQKCTSESGRFGHQVT